MTDVATSVLMDDKGRILILKRSDKVRTYKGCWSGIAGYVEKDEEPLETAFKEISEEVGLSNDDVVLVKQVDPVEIADYHEGVHYTWKIFPFLFKTGKKSKVQIDWEHTEYRWINPSDIGEYDTVPHLEDVVLELLE
jgi:8-oxo-dGTP pyrophosphatase MutT (NUDIX family)